jgi:hypothetical protein
MEGSNYFIDLLLIIFSVQYFLIFWSIKLSGLGGDFRLTKGAYRKPIHKCAQFFVLSILEFHTHSSFNIRFID